MTFQSNKAIHPGVSVNAALAHLGMSQKNLAERSGLSEKTVSQIINGESSISAETAMKFEKVLGGSAAFWLNLESNYRTTLIRSEQQELANNEVKLSRNFPYNELAKRNCVKVTRNPIERVQNLWNFFGVDSLTLVPQIEIAAYRRGFVEDSEVKRGAIAAWLRCGEIEYYKELSSKISDFNASKVKELFPYLRSSTRMESKNFFNDLQEKLASAGVGLIAVQYFSGTKASGATRWIGQNPVIQLSTFGKDADKIWFTLFHELGHVLLHGKKESFISFTDTSKVPEEIEADDFARHKLIPRLEYKKFISNSDCLLEINISRFAEAHGIDIGIVVGRMKRDGLLAYSDYPHLHRKMQMRDER